MELGPGAALFSRWRALRQFETPGYKALYYGLISVPLGFSLALMARIGSGLSAMARGCGLLIPSAILEPILAGVSRRPMYPGNVLLGIGLASASFFFLDDICRVSCSTGIADSASLLLVWNPLSKKVRVKG